MKPMKFATAAILGTTLMAGAGTAAMAAGQGSHQGDTQATAMAAQAKVSLGHAVAAAQKAAGGHAIDAGLADESGKSGWEVELAQADGSVKTVLVDLQSGSVNQNPQMENGDSEKNGAADTEESDGEGNGVDLD